MMLKVVHKFWLTTLLALPVINSFCDSEKKFEACQKFSSGGAARMSKQEMIENFMQCAGITDYKSREIIENKLDPAEKNSNVDKIQKIILEAGRIGSAGAVLVSAAGYIGSLYEVSCCKDKSFGWATAAGVGFYLLFGAADLWHTYVRMYREKE